MQAFRQACPALSRPLAEPAFGLASDQALTEQIAACSLPRTPRLPAPAGGPRHHASQAGTQPLPSPGHGADDVGELRKRVEALEARIAELESSSVLSRSRPSCRRSPPSKPRKAPASSKRAAPEIARRMGRLADGVRGLSPASGPPRPRKSAGRVERGQHAAARLWRHPSRGACARCTGRAGGALADQPLGGPRPHPGEEPAARHGGRGPAALSRRLGHAQRRRAPLRYDGLRGPPRTRPRLRRQAGAARRR